MAGYHKPIVGTRLVPSIENIEGCFKYGGEWAHKTKVCFEKESSLIRVKNIFDYTNCTAPIKGVHLCWGIQEVTPRGWEDPLERIPFVDYVLAKTGDVIDYHLTEDPKNYAVKEYQVFTDEKRSTDKKRMICCNPRGRIISCDRPDAILTNKGKNITAIAHGYRNMLGDRAIADVKPYERNYTEASDETTPTKFSRVEGIPALESLWDRNMFYGMRHIMPSPAQISLEGHQVSKEEKIKFDDYPDIDTPKKCFGWGGKWDSHAGLCFSKKYHSIAPVKGVECTWGSLETECVKYDPTKRKEEWKDCYEPTVSCFLYGLGEEGMVYDTFDNGGEVFSDDYRDRYEGYQFPLESNEADEEAKSHAIDVAREISRGNANFFGMKYYTPQRQECHSDHPMAVASDNPKKIKYRDTSEPPVPKIKPAYATTQAPLKINFRKVKK